MKSIEGFFCIAPMMGKTDSYFCYLMKLINKKTIIYTEMMHAETIIRTNILENYIFLDNLNNVAVQIAGNDPERLALAAKKASGYGFNEININCGCPSKRVVAGKFGINLLLNPKLVSQCVAKIYDKISTQVSIKTRIGVDNYTSDFILDNFLKELNKAGIKKYIIHARVALRRKLNTKDNLNIPSLNYERVYKLKKSFQNNNIIINGGFKKIESDSQIMNKIDGIMIGREAYKNPWIFNEDLHYKDLEERKLVINLYLQFLKLNFRKSLFNKNALVHIQNIFNGYEGAKKWRQVVSNALETKDLNDLLKFLDCDKIKVLCI